MNKNRRDTIISILIPVVMILFIVNFIYDIFLNLFFGIAIFLPLFLCPLGSILAISSYKEDENIWAVIGIILNVIVFFVPFIWIIGGIVME
ncbi:hypothetical protein [Bacillus sp. AR2-1]|uniref:hypothetical protein n=1 Tax=Bacillus cereus group TaxID=86661 RepID=UPI00351B2CED